MAEKVKGKVIRSFVDKETKKMFDPVKEKKWSGSEERKAELIVLGVLEDDKQSDTNEDTDDNDNQDGTDEVNLEGLEAKELKVIADGRGIEYAKNANTDQMLALIQGKE